jgi:hypothetical protein
MKKIIVKSAMAMAIAAVSSGVFAAGTFVATPNAVVLANEVFGTGSESTPVATPSTTYTVDVAKSAIGAGEVATIKLTLNKGAVFADDLSTIDKWAGSLATGLVFTFDSGAVTVGGAGAPYVQDAHWEIKVDQGGTIGNNTVTFKITNLGVAGTLDLVDSSQIAVKNLTSALARGVATPVVNLGVEFRNVSTTVTDTAPSVAVFESQDGVAFGDLANGYANPVITDYTGAPGLRSRIAVSSLEKKFTNLVGTAASQDFDETNDITYVDFGNLTIVRTKKYADEVKKENGDDFDFNSDDQVKVTFSNENTFDAYSGVYLRPGTASLCTGATAGGDKIATLVAGSKDAVISLAGQDTTALNNGYRVCAIAKTTAVIPEDTFSAKLGVTYFNPRYTTSADTLEFGRLLRNGCQVTLFNLPAVTAQDDAFIRITNVSEKPGAVRVSVWPEDGGPLVNGVGTTIDSNTVVVPTLAAHATAVLHTSADQATGQYLGAKLPTYAALATGRHRLVIQGAFPACEALGLVRTPSGVLSNMTSTTYSGDATRLGSQNNGTSNTSN